MKTPRRTSLIWAVIDTTNHYFIEVFGTKREAEAYQRGTSYVEDGKFVIVQGYFAYHLPKKKRGRK